jgi:hypothetical protein
VPGGDPCRQLGEETAKEVVPVGGSGAAGLVLAALVALTLAPACSSRSVGADRNAKDACVALRVALGSQTAAGIQENLARAVAAAQHAARENGKYGPFAKVVANLEAQLTTINGSTSTAASDAAPIDGICTQLGIEIAPATA